MFSVRMPDVEEFMRKLNNNEYVVNSEKNIELAKSLSNALERYENENHIGVVPSAIIVDRVYSLINSAILQNVVTEKQDIRKQLKDAENKLNECEQKQSILEKNNQDLIRTLAEREEYIKVLEKRTKNQGEFGN